MAAPPIDAGASCSPAAHQLAESLRPSVEEAVRISVEEDPRVLADALYPAMGPAIRQAIVSAWNDMVQALSRILNDSFSLRGLVWRWEAFRTGRPVGEVAYYHSLRYAVEEVLLIHRQTGLLLHQAARDTTVARDSDLIAGMLTAIQDFVKDSFQIDHGTALDALRLGEFTVWVEQGPQAILAAVIRGQPPPELRYTFRDALEKVHRRSARELLVFNGESDLFEACGDILETCLVSELEPQRKPSRIPLLVASSIIVMLGMLWAGFTAYSRYRWNAFIQALESQPGIIVTHAERGWRRSTVEVLRDPLSEDPRTIVASMHMSNVTCSWKPFLSLDARIVLARARRVLAPPDGVSFALDGDVLRVSGDPSPAWVIRSRSAAAFVPGVRELRFEGGLQALRNSIEQQRFHFAVGSSRLDEADKPMLDRLAIWIREVSSATSLRVRITGHADASGREALNATLSMERAGTVKRALVARGVDEAGLEESGEGAGEFGRTVSFRVIDKALP